jgi:hypothetical protein
MASRLIFLVALALPAAAAAHDADLILIAPRQDGAETVVAATMTAQTLAMLAPIDADGDGLFSQADADHSEQAIALGFWAQCPLSPCARLSTRTWVQQSAVVLEARYRCPEGELSQTFKVLSVLPRNYTVALSPQAGLGKQEVRFPASTLILRSGPQGSRPLPPPPLWVWAIFLLIPTIMMLFERRRF